MKCYIAICVLLLIVPCLIMIENKLSGQFAGTSCGVEVGSNLIYHNPWLVYLEFYRHKFITYMRCGGTLVNSRYVITAGHCVKKSKYSRLVARLGENDTSLKEDCFNEVCADPTLRIDVTDVIVHPEYDSTNHDIAVLRLKKDVPYTDFIRPICLPSGNLDKDVTFNAAGWGEVPFTGQYSKTKKMLSLPNWDLDKCQSAYENTKLPDKVICAGGEEGIDTCRGDSGGPLMLLRDKIELWGVTSGGNVICGSKGYPGIYTSVFEHLDWIKKEIGT